LQKDKQKVTCKYEGMIKKNAMRGRCNISENEKRGLKGEKGRERTKDLIK
jgi:hypothetical protein